jgi:hypothetical protein
MWSAECKTRRGQAWDTVPPMMDQLARTGRANTASADTRAQPVDVAVGLRPPTSYVRFRTRSSPYASLAPHTVRASNARAQSLCTLHSAFCTPHSALRNSALRNSALRWCAHRPVRTVPGTPGVRFRCAHRVLRTKGHLQCAAERGHVRHLHAASVWGGQRRNESFCGQSALLRVGSWPWHTVRVCPVPTPTCTTRVVCGTRYSVLGTRYSVRGTGYFVRGTGYAGTGYVPHGRRKLVLAARNPILETANGNRRPPVCNSPAAPPAPSRIAGRLWRPTLAA